MLRNTILILVLLLASPLGAIDISRTLIFDIPAEVVERETGDRPGSALSAEELAEMSDWIWDGDTMKVLVILVEWSDRQHTYSREAFDTLIFSRNVLPYGSLADFIYENSYGKVTMVGDVYGWYDYGTYNPNVEYWDYPDLLDSLDPYIDFSLYDGNHDDDVDALIYIRAGTGMEDTGDTLDSWTYAVPYPPGSEYGMGPFDGVLVNAWTNCPETRPTRDPANPDLIIGDTLKGMRIVAHELGHLMGLYELYDWDCKLDTASYDVPDDCNDHPVYDWGLMAYYGYGMFSVGGDHPNHFHSRNKMRFGWIEPTVIESDSAEIVLTNIETTDQNSLFMVPISLSTGEYFLLEYRSPYSTAIFDKFDSDFSVFFPSDLTLGWDVMDRGLLISHIDDGMGNNSNGPRQPRYLVAVEDAGYNPNRDAWSNPEGFVTDSAQWWYPFETRKGACWSSETPGQERFGPDTYPSSDSYYGPTGIQIRVDSIVDDRLYAFVINPMLGDNDDDGVRDIDDNCPFTYNPDQSNVDGDFMGDSCDNCIDEYNPWQMDWDHDDVGFVCDNCPDIPNSDQTDVDGDGLGDLCDNCPDSSNADQDDEDEDGKGDACDCCLWTTGNIDNDPGEIVDIGDLTTLIGYLFIPPFTPPVCLEEGNVDGIGTVDIGDLTALIGYLFIPPFTPPADCN